jgi:TRAP-type C4-dicarboxylate transport system substrate-binding protein
MRRTISGLILTALAATALATPASAQATTVKRLRVADSFPTGHYLSRLLLQPWMNEVTKRTNGAVVFDYFPGQQLGKAADMLTLTQNGVADIGYVAPGYVSDKMPTSEVAMLPGSFSTACEGTNAYWKVAREGLCASRITCPTRSACC